jgi:MFS family permease
MLPLIGAAFGPFVGYISDIYGRRRFLLIGAIFGALGNLGSACSNTVPKIYGTEIIVGFGILNRQVAVAAIAEIFPRSWRPFVFGCFWASLAPAEAFAPVIGRSEWLISCVSADECEAQLLLLLPLLLLSIL